MTGLAIDFFNIPGAMMRVLNCFTRRGLIIESVWCTPSGDRHCATVLTEAKPLTMEQIVRELESTVGVDRVATLSDTQVEKLAKLPSPALPTA
jgi:acetolactate synthase small subunit